MCAALCVGCSCIPIAVQRQMVREKHNLEGDTITDFLLSWCCGCCTIIQNGKELEHQHTLLSQGATDQQYQTTTGMSYPAQ